MMCRTPQEITGDQILTISSILIGYNVTLWLFRNCHRTGDAFFVLVTITNAFFHRTSKSWLSFDKCSQAPGIRHMRIESWCGHDEDCGRFSLSYPFHTRYSPVILNVRSRGRTQGSPESIPRRRNLEAANADIAVHRQAQDTAPDLNMENMRDLLFGMADICYSFCF